MLTNIHEPLQSCMSVQFIGNHTYILLCNKNERSYKIYQSERPSKAIFVFLQNVTNHLNVAYCGNTSDEEVYINYCWAIC